MVTLAERLSPDGRYIQLARDLKRARYRESMEVEKLVTPGEIICYEFDSFMFFSRLVSKGSRLRLTFASPSTIHCRRTITVAAWCTKKEGTEAGRAHRAHHAAVTMPNHPSYLELPIVATTSAPVTAQKYCRSCQTGDAD